MFFSRQVPSSLSRSQAVFTSYKQRPSLREQLFLCLNYWSWKFWRENLFVEVSSRWWFFCLWSFLCSARLGLILMPPILHVVNARYTFAYTWLQQVPQVPNHMACMPCTYSLYSSSQFWMHGTCNDIHATWDMMHAITSEKHLEGGICYISIKIFNNSWACKNTGRCQLYCPKWNRFEKQFFVMLFYSLGKK